MRGNAKVTLLSEHPILPPPTKVKVEATLSYAVARKLRAFLGDLTGLDDDGGLFDALDDAGIKRPEEQS